MKSESVSKWRLRRTLRRPITYRPIEEDDIKYLYAAYKLGKMDELGLPPDLPPGAFAVQFKDTVLNNFHAVWVAYGGTPKGNRLTGIMFASWLPCLRHYVCNLAVYMPWCSKRNIIETAVSTINDVRKTQQLLLYAVDDHKKLYEICCMHGVLRRVGTSYTAFPGKAAAVFETRTK